MKGYGAATTASTQLAISQGVIPNISLPETFGIDIPYAPGSDGTLSVLMPPGRYTVKLNVGGREFTQPLDVRADPANPGAPWRRRNACCPDALDDARR